MKMDGRALLELLKKTWSEWNEDKAPRLAAALAYYTIFSLAPLLIIAIAIAGLAYGQQTARSQIVGQFQNLVGETGAQAVQALLEGASRPGASAVATILGTATLLLGAAGLYGQLQDALNTIWEVAPKPGLGLTNMIRDRFMSFTMVLGTGFLLLVSLIISAGLQAFGGYLASLAPNLGLILELLNTVISFAVITFLFAMIFKVLPDVNIAWSDVWIGALVTALLFTIGKFAIGFYLGRSNTPSAYGAAGSLVVLLIWVYYAAQILLLGAEFTQVYANLYGSRGVPSPNALPLTERARAEQGIPRVSEGHAQTGTAVGALGRDEVTLPEDRVALSVAAGRSNGTSPRKPAFDNLAAGLLGFAVGVAVAVRRTRTPGTGDGQRQA